MNTAKISAKIIAHSKSYINGEELISIETYAPKFLDAEIEKHRMISSNSSSDRAIPVLKMIEQEYFIPEDIRLNQRGMQGENKLNDINKSSFKEEVLCLRDHACDVIIEYKEIHKQHLNRYLLPFSMQKKIMTANKNQWDYFLSLRLHEAADPAIYELANCINKIISESKPKELKLNEWHLPYILDFEVERNDLIDLLKMSSARCARTSYNNHDGSTSSKENDFKLFDFLVGSDPQHATPVEHQAKPMEGRGFSEVGVNLLNKDGRYFSGNFHSFVQFRKILEEKDWKI